MVIINGITIVYCVQHVNLWFVMNVIIGMYYNAMVIMAVFVKISVVFVVMVLVIVIAWCVGRIVSTCFVVVVVSAWVVVAVVVVLSLVVVVVVVIVVIAGIVLCCSGCRNDGQRHTDKQTDGTGQTD